MSRAFLERAFELARSGRCASLKDLRRTLKAERYSVGEFDQVRGAALKRQLLDLIANNSSKAETTAVRGTAAQ